MKTKQTIITLGILLTVSASIGQLTWAAKPTDSDGKSRPAIHADSKAGSQKHGPAKPQKAGAGNKGEKPPVGQADVGKAVYGDNSVVISGGFNTDPRDHGRPVVLIAAALGVPTEVFREAFRGVTPADQGSGPTPEEAQKNKAALLKVLAPYGITNEKLDEVSNYYRYNGIKGETWKSTKATATAIVTDGAVTGIKITNAGAGYSSNPTVTVNGPQGKITATATVVYTKDFKRNGSISELMLTDAKPTTNIPTAEKLTTEKLTTGKPKDGNNGAADGSVVISGGFETDPQDHGRPVILIAAALGVPTEVFREAFSGVTPADQGSGGPTSEEAQKNKAALLKVLAPYGITNERLDEVSNYYRYNGSRGETWKSTKATAAAIVTNGVVTGVKITNAGSGYSSNPTIIINGPQGKITATASVIYTKDFKTNGSISAITIK